MRQLAGNYGLMAHHYYLRCTCVLLEFNLIATRPAYLHQPSMSIRRNTYFLCPHHRMRHAARRGEATGTGQSTADSGKSVDED